MKEDCNIESVGRREGCLVGPRSRLDMKKEGRQKLRSRRAISSG